MIKTLFYILFAFDDSLAAVLTQKEEGGDEFPISFMSTGLQGAELNYPAIDKQAYTVFKGVKQFRPYILKNRTKVRCPLFTAPESWYRDLVHYMQVGLLPKHWNSKQRRVLRLKSSAYQLVEGVLFRKNYDGVLLRCLEKEDAKKVMA